jgi:hypothetical protein
MRFSIEDFTAETFFPYQGQRLPFQRPPDGSGTSGDVAELELLEVTRPERVLRIEKADPDKHAKRLREPFSLLFALRGQAPLGMGLHRLVHTDFEPCELLLSRVFVPGRGTGDGTVMYYEAVFG